MEGLPRPASEDHSCMELQMHSPMIRPALVLGFVLAAGIVPAPAALAQPNLKVRCNQLVSYYAR
jgi:hypothetical protein